MTTAIATTQPQDVLAAVLADTDRLKELEIDKVERLFALAREMQSDAASAVSSPRRSTPYSATWLRFVSWGGTRHTKKPPSPARKKSPRMLDPIILAHGF